MVNLLILSAICSIAVAVPAANPSGCKTYRKEYTAKYDDLPFTEGPPNPIPPHYYGLSYLTFQVDQYDFFIQPTSGNQYAMAFGGKGNITIPDSPPNRTLDLKSFSYACDSGIPQPECEIRMFGFKENGKVVERTITFPRLDPGHFPNEFVMNSTTFNGEWKNLKSVGFSTVIADTGEDFNGGLMLDDVKYVINENVCG